MRLKFDPEAASAYEAIVDDEALDKLDMVFDALEKDPGQAWLRGHRWSDPPLWGVTLRCRHADLLVLWAAETYDGEPAAVVRYVGPAVPG